MKLDEAMELLRIPKPQARIPNVKKCAMVKVGQMAITDAKSECPVLTNVFASTCLAIFAYDPKRKRLGAFHTSRLGPEMDDFIAAVRDGDDSRPLELYVVGGQKDGLESFSKKYADELIQHLSERVPNVTLKHVDIFAKNKGIQDHAMDARTGDFFFLKKDRQSLTRREIIDSGKLLTISRTGLIYDGSLPEHQQQYHGKFTAKKSRELAAERESVV